MFLFEKQQKENTKWQISEWLQNDITHHFYGMEPIKIQFPNNQTNGSLGVRKMFVSMN